MSSNPLPLYVSDETGLAGPPLGSDTLPAVLPDLPGAEVRANAATTLSIDAGASQDNIRQAGWGVLFAADVSDDIRAQLAPLLKLRRSQIPPPRPGPYATKDLYQEFTVPVGMTANQWIESFQTPGVTLLAPVQPWLGVPYYLMIVGSPESISFEFQALLKMQWAVGRLWFDDAADFGKYAAAVVAYETAQTLDQSRNVALWMPSIAGDPATTQLSSTLQTQFLHSAPGPLGENSQFEVEPYIGPGAATFAQLVEIFRGNLKQGRPSVIFAGSHGLQCTYSATDPAFPERQRQRQGALITQDWNRATPGKPPTWVLTGDDVPADSRLDGTIVFLFACYSGGCPKGDSYRSLPDGSPVPIAAADMISRLPQVLLSRGALAVIGHVDEAWSYSFAGVNGQPGVQSQPQVIGNPLQLLMQGKQAGIAADSLTGTWTTLSALSSDAQPLAAGGTAAAPDLAAKMQPAGGTSGIYPLLVVARNDARNYILLGDPAVKLRVNDLQDPG